VPTFARRQISALAKGALQSAFVTTLPAGFRMSLDPSEWLQSQLRHYGTIEPKTVGLMRSLLEPGDTDVDVGAHVGFHTLIARAKIGPEGTVVAIEPQPYNCAKLLENWRINGFANVIAYVGATSNVERILVLHDQPPVDRSRLSITAPSLAGDQPQRFAVPALRLEAVIDAQHLDTVRLLKIDAEGHELETIQGLGDRIARVENIIVEVWDATRPEYVELTNILHAAGFTLRTVETTPWAQSDPIPEMNLWAAR
jgi:FkbM family methyltransferase